MSEKNDKIMIVGEVLYILHGNYKKLCGSPFHIVYHLALMGVPVCFVSRVGEDTEGAKSLSVFQKSDIDTRAVQIDPVHQTGVGQIVETEDQYEYELFPNLAFDYIAFDDVIREELNNRVNLIYFDTLIQRSPVSHNTFELIIENRSSRTRCFYDVNLKKTAWNGEIVMNSLHHSDIVKISDDDLKEMKKLTPDSDSDESFIREMISTYSIEWVCLMRDEEIIELFTEGGHFLVNENNRNTFGVFDTFGFDDAFAAILMAGYVNGWSPETTLNRAFEFGKRICQIKGALPYSESFYDEYAHWFQE